MKDDPTLEKQKSLQEKSINLALSHRGWKAIRNAGVEEEVKKIAIPMSGRIMHDTDGQLTYQAYGKKMKPSTPYLEVI